MTDLQERLARLTPQQRELLARRMQPAPVGPPPIQPQSRATASFPLSFGQQRLWFLDQWDPGSPLYNCPVPLRLHGPLDVPILQRSLELLMARHEGLRTTFPTVDGQARQVIAPPTPLDLPVVDLSADPDALDAQMDRESRRPFDLSAGPLCRATLYRLAPDEHLLLIVNHHIITDGWSDGVLLGELSACYQALRAGRPPTLPPLPVQYADYSVWQRETLQGPLLDAQIAYWRTRLQGAPTTLDLPTDRARPAARAGRGTLRQFVIAPELTAGLRALQGHEGGTLFMLTMAAFAALLQRYTGRNDVLIGTPIAGRNQPAVEGIVGFFVNTLVLRVDLHGDPSFTTLLARVRESVAEAYGHQDVPFERLVDELGLERSLSYTPLVQTMFAFQPRGEDDLTLGDVQASREAVGTGTSRFDLLISINEVGQELHAAVEYDTELFDDSTITRIFGHYATLLAGIVANPAARLSSLPLLPGAERRQILAEWNATARPYPADSGLPALFAAQAAQTPDALAVVFGAQRLTYRELDSRANQLAHYLRAQGAGRGTFVALCLERSADLVVAMLAILKAGAAYVPLDPTYPAERLAFMLADSRAPLLLTQQALAGKLPATDARLLYIDTDAKAIAAAPDTDPAPALTGDDAAYVMYTSGSTGRPKGIVIPQRAIAHLVLGTDYLQLTPADRVAQASNASFDAATFEVWGALLNGAQLVGIPQDVLLAPPALAAHLRDTGISAIFLTVALFNQVVAAAPDAFAPVRHVMFGGDAADAPTVRRILAAQRPARLLNVYGPTESTTFATWYPIDGVPEQATSVPIGRPIANTTLYILDPVGQPVPVGVTGELYLGGDGLAWGYLNRPDLTAERFLPHPFSTTPGARLYRTGDLARWRADGNVEFQGRSDQQVKIRGFRIELGEIEAALGAYPGVEEVTVLAREDLPGNKQLVAYVVNRAGAAPDVAALRQFLAAHLPAYMVPAAFVTLPALPLTANGKVDRRALPAPDQAPAARTREIVAPRTPEEQALAAIWSQVLRGVPVGVTDNFFELGGDSILSIQIIARARAVGLHLTPRQMFQYQTVAELCAVAKPATESAAGQEPVMGPVALTPIERWFFAQALPDPQHFNMEFTLDVPAGTDARLLAQALGHLARHHDALRLRFHHEAGGWAQEDAAPDTANLYRFTQVDLSGLAPEAQEAAITREAAALHTGLDLAQGPPVAVALFGRGPAQPARLVLVFHHLVMDGVSWRVVLEDLETAYRQLEQGTAVQLPPKTTSFQAWAARLAEYADSPALAGEAAYWRGVADGAVPALPVDHLGGANTVASAETYTATLDAATTHALLHDVPPVYHTQINDVLLTALALALGRWTGSLDVLVDLEGHGREPLFADVDLSRTVGWFTSIYPVRLDLTGRLLPEAALPYVKEALRAIPQHGIGSGLLRYRRTEPAPTTNGSGPGHTGEVAWPTPQISFNYLGQFDPAEDADVYFRAAEPTGAAGRSPRGPRAHLIEVDSLIADGQLEVTWSYSTALHRPATIAALAEDYMAALRDVIAHCQSPEAGGYTPSDFPLARLDEAGLQKLSAQLPAPVGRRPLDAVEDLYPLSFMQEGMLFHTLYTPDSGVYCTQVCWVVEGALDRAAWHAAWQQAVDRYAIFRTAFVSEGLARPLQVVYHQVAVPWEELDWQAVPAAEHEARLLALLAADRTRGFDPATAPLMRVVLVQTGPARYYCLWSHHHLLLDGWSFSRVLGEIFTAYDDLHAGRPVAPVTVRPYRNYIAWLQQQDLAAAEAFWRATLAGYDSPATVALPPPDPGTQPATVPVLEVTRLDEETTAQLNALARREHLTVNTLVQGAWALLLSAYSGQHDVVFGATTSGRPADLPGAEEMIGLFINTLPVRIDTRPTQALLPWLQGIQAQQVETRRYEYSPLVQVQTWSDVPPGQALFDTLYVYENYPLDAAGDEVEGDLRFDLAYGGEETNYPLDIIAVPGDALELRIGYDTARFSQAAVRRLLEQFRTLLAGMAAAGETTRLADLPLLPAAERAQVLGEWATPAAPAAPDTCWHELVAAQAARTPAAIALAGDGRQFTYAELNAQANQVARELRARGVGPDVAVGLGMPRTPELIIGLLGILKAGGAYVPLDPAYPADRLAYIVADAGIRLVLTGAGPAPALPDGVTALRVDLLPAPGPADLTNPVSGVTLGNLAYLIYTSGSTGRPKGVMVTHQGLAHYTAHVVHTYAPQPDDRVLLYASINFDASVFDIVAALSVGAALVLTPPDLLPGPELVRLLADERITIASFAPAVLAAIPDAQVPEMRMLVVGGDACTPDLVRRWAPGRQFVNAYGPTEITVETTVAFCQPQDGPGAVPIGRPIGNSRAYVLDASGRPLPIGVPGELYIGGAGVARGYLHRPDLTAERFVPDPYSDEPGARLYRTGDQVRWQPDGQLEFLGRVDRQVKIRGFRIELGEIEARLLAHPAVQAAAVQVREDRPGDARLVAYLVWQPGQEAPLDTLRGFLREQLPAYMVPAAFVVLPALPLTPNGKLDRRALPAAEAAPGGPDAGYVAPRTALEDVLAGIWADTLHLEQVGVEDNFFVVGGHSLLATQVIAAVHEIFGLPLPVRALFDHPTVASLAEAVRAADPEQAEKTATLLIQLSAQSDEELEALLAERGGIAVEEAL